MQDEDAISMGIVLFRDYFDYRTNDKTAWRCWRDGKDGFFHAPSGDRAKGHRDTIINYVTWGGGMWQAEWQDDGFYHAPIDGTKGDAHSAAMLRFAFWNDSTRTNGGRRHGFPTKESSGSNGFIPNNRWLGKF